jgi:hypothetical protein
MERLQTLAKQTTFIGLIIYIVTLLLNNNVYATSWAALKPEEVKNRAEVIVLGKYDFSSKPKRSEMIFAGYSFNVKKVFKGEPPKTMTAGIDGNDVGWSNEFQSNGGEFLLFLEKTKYADFLTPVGGPNGMIEITKGKVEDRDYQDYYQDFLKTDSKESSGTNKDSKEKNDNQDKSPKKYMVTAGLMIIGVFLIILMPRNRTRS